ncbi:putative permease [Thioflavicoccus mobilis 8321]|uniref:Putative permease n=1 Tax=Thioflavicoccus mobilis 8321 TaxID=765912 RepID=L0GVC8_9GAMM|nr:AEC family transporter [Thioflavicoccus mobilis]AGA89936.1 putative permease [Thioflavicoccus mobilis 8321]
MFWEKLIESVGLLVILILLGVVLRRIGLLRDEHGPLLARLVTQVTLPALIFSALARSTMQWVYLELAGAMLFAETLCLALGWILARAARLGPAQSGAVILTAGFGSSSLLGYPLISALYPDDAPALMQAAVISELGVAPLLFTVGTMIALYYGAHTATNGTTPLRAALKFFYSPIFIALCAGLAWSLAGLPHSGPGLDMLFRGLGQLADANTFLVALTVGVALRFDGLRAILWLALGVAAIKLLLKPLLVWLPAHWIGVSSIELQILLIEATMPSAMLTAVLARSYGCDATLASKLILATSLASIATVVLMLELLAP